MSPDGEKFLARIPEARARYPRWDEVMELSRLHEIPFTDDIAAIQYLYRSPVAHDVLYALAERPRDATWVGRIGGAESFLALLIYERQIDRMLGGWSERECGPLTDEQLEWLQWKGMQPD